jgi:hypothetical protein
LALASPAIRDEYCADWCALEATAAQRLSRQRGANASCSAWRLWENICAQLQLDPYDLGSHDPMPLLLLFSQRYRTGAIAPGRHPVRSRTVEDAVRAIDQAYAQLGSPDPRLSTYGDVDFRLTSLYRAWQRGDAPPGCVEPLPLYIVAQVWNLSLADDTPLVHTAAQCLIVGFYFLLRPGEYLGRPTTIVHTSLTISSTGCPILDQLSGLVYHYLLRGQTPSKHVCILNLL